MKTFIQIFTVTVIFLGLGISSSFARTTSEIMTNENLWTGEATIFIVQEIDDNLKMEDWMINENNWNINTPIIIEDEAEEKLDLESWMTNENIWKK